MKPYIMLLLLIPVNFLSPQTTKKGGICFRVDDNKTIEQFNEYAQKFNAYGKKFCFALNLAGRYFDTQEYIDEVEHLQSNGHELMDHTPSHSTSFFITKFEPASYSSLPGIDHINKNKICLKYTDKFNTNRSIRTGHVDIYGNVVTTASNEFSKFYHGERFLYFPQIFPKKIFAIKQINSPDSLIITDAWMDEVKLGKHKNIKYYSFLVSSIHISIEGLNLLANETQKLADLYNLDNPVTWIEPGISKHVAFPYLHRKEMHQSFGKNFNYVAAAVYPGHAQKVFCEANPDSDKEFAMQWGDFNVDSDPLRKTKTIIANGIAKHCVLIGSTHFTNLLGGWNAYLERVDSLLSWCVKYNIPVHTYKEWANILYNERPDSTENIFPPLFNDFDENNIPDGYELKKGMWEATDGVSDSKNYCFSINSKGTIFEIQNLGGIEKGSNSFLFRTKGSPGDSVQVMFSFGNKIKTFKFPAENNKWTLYSLDSLKNNNILNIPKSVSTINISVKCSDYSSGKVKVSGFKLYKKNKLETLSLSDTTFNVNADSGHITFTISSNTNWNISSTANWLNAIPLCGNGNNTVTVYYSANIDTLLRQAKLIINGNTLTKQISVTQKGLVTTVNDKSILTQKIKLFQNYPNPFNPVTTIKYSITTPPQPSPYQWEGVREGLFVTLKVYNILGKEVATLVNKKQKPGNYKVTFDAHNLPSGIYFYQLKKGTFNQIRKMIFLK